MIQVSWCVHVNINLFQFLATSSCDWKAILLQKKSMKKKRKMSTQFSIFPSQLNLLTLLSQTDQTEFLMLRAKAAGDRWQPWHAWRSLRRALSCQTRETPRSLLANRTTQHWMPQMPVRALGDFNKTQEMRKNAQTSKQRLCQHNQSGLRRKANFPSHCQKSNAVRLTEN